MPDPTTAEVTETEPTADTTTGTATETDWEAEAKKWKALSRKNEDEAKSLRPAAQKLTELEEANKSEIEKAQARADAAEKELNSTRIEALRNSVALDKKLTPSQAKRLIGATREELEADADDLLADLKSQTPPATASSDGQGKQGEPVGSAKQITSRDQLKNMTSAEIVEARKAGRLDGLMGVQT